ncbi:MAG: AraC family transcriptional regulator, partial [Burkholderiales bacterium]|nr:AraC family transcriptional regulator [Burkholderiales bacterium]
TTFTAVVDGVRGELLSRYLADGGLPLSEVSALLGFSDPSVFSRWHRHRFGVAARNRVKTRASRLAFRR